MAVDNSGVSDDFSPDLGLTKCQFGFTERLLRYPSRALIGDDRVCADRFYGYLDSLQFLASDHSGKS
jgi:hypothetical protein